jgi:hypothetical protein
MRKVSSKLLTAIQKAELKKVTQLAEDRINTRSVPEARDWSGAKRSLFYRVEGTK